MNEIKISRKQKLSLISFIIGKAHVILAAPCIFLNITLAVISLIVASCFLILSVWLVLKDKKIRGY